MPSRSAHQFMVYTSEEPTFCAEGGWSCVGYCTAESLKDLIYSSVFFCQSVYAKLSAFIHVCALRFNVLDAFEGSASTS